MRWLAISTCLLVTLAGTGCHDKFDAALGDIEGFRARMCACADKPCAEQVQGEWRAYREKLRDSLAKDDRPTKTQDRKATLLDDAIRACRKRLEPELPGLDGDAATAPVTSGTR